MGRGGIEPPTHGFSDCAKIARKPADFLHKPFVFNTLAQIGFIPLRCNSMKFTPYSSAKIWAYRNPWGVLYLKPLRFQVGRVAKTPLISLRVATLFRGVFDGSALRWFKIFVKGNNNIRWKRFDYQSKMSFTFFSLFPSLPPSSLKNVLWPNFSIEKGIGLLPLLISHRRTPPMKPFTSPVPVVCFPVRKLSFAKSPVKNTTGSSNTHWPTNYSRRPSTSPFAKVAPIAATIMILYSFAKAAGPPADRVHTSKV